MTRSEPARQALSLEFEQTAEGYSVKLDGHPIEHAVREISVYASPDEGPTACLVLNVRPLVNLPDASVRVSFPVHDALVRLGWTPPPPED